MKKIYLFVFSGLLLLVMSGCGTVKGIGQDISTVGHWVTRGADNAK